MVCEPHGAEHREASGHKGRRPTCPAKTGPAAGGDWTASMSSVCGSIAEPTRGVGGQCQALARRRAMRASGGAASLFSGAESMHKNMYNFLSLGMSRTCTIGCTYVQLLVSRSRHAAESPAINPACAHQPPARVPHNQVRFLIAGYGAA